MGEGVYHEPAESKVGDGREKSQKAQEEEFPFMQCDPLESCISPNVVRGMLVRGMGRIVCGSFP